MKWLSKLFKSGSSRGGGGAGGRHPQLIGEENMVWRAPSRSLVNNTLSSPHYPPSLLISRRCQLDIIRTSPLNENRSLRIRSKIVWSLFCIFLHGVSINLKKTCFS